MATFDLVRAPLQRARTWGRELIDQLARLGRNHPDEVDWDWAAAGAAAGGCPECAGAERAQASAAEVALLRAVNRAGREEMVVLRHRIALLTDELAAEKRISAGLLTERAAQSVRLAEIAVGFDREIEEQRREKAMRRGGGTTSTIATGNPA